MRIRRTFLTRDRLTQHLAEIKDAMIRAADLKIVVQDRERKLKLPQSISCMV